MAVIIGDIHGDIEKVMLFLAYEPGDLHLSLGDIVDSRGRSKVDLEAEMACLDLLLSSETVLLWGNHDLAYLPERPWRCFGNFGETAFRTKYQTARNRFFAAYAIDGWLCTHAGVSPKIAKLMPAGVLVGGTETVANWLKVKFEREMTVPNLDARGCRFGYGPLFKIPVCRGGFNEYGGIFWHDAEGEQSQPAPTVGRQIFGHSPGPAPERGKSWVLSQGNSEVGKGGVDWINLDANEGGVWIYNTRTDKIVNLLA